MVGVDRRRCQARGDLRLPVADVAVMSQSFFAFGRRRIHAGLSLSAKVRLFIDALVAHLAALKGSPSSHDPD
jgi:hypothetical protein